MKQIKIITAVDRIPVSSLSGMTRLSGTSVRLPADITWQPVQVKPHAQLTITDKVEDKVKVWTAKLVFKTCEVFCDRDRWAYRCRLQNGQCRLIGTSERPYPVTSVAEVMPENLPDNQLNEVTVSWQTPTFIPVIVE